MNSLRASAKQLSHRMELIMKRLLRTLKINVKHYGKHTKILTKIFTIESHLRILYCWKNKVVHIEF